MEHDRKVELLRIFTKLVAHIIAEFLEEERFLCDHCRDLLPRSMGHNVRYEDRDNMFLVGMCEGCEYYRELREEYAQEQRECYHYAHYDQL